MRVIIATLLTFATLSAASVNAAAQSQTTPAGLTDEQVKACDYRFFISWPAGATEADKNALGAYLRTAHNCTPQGRQPAPAPAFWPAGQKPELTGSFVTSKGGTWTWGAQARPKAN